MSLLKESINNKVKIGFNDFRNCSISKNLVPETQLYLPHFHFNM